MVYRVEELGKPLMWVTRDCPGWVGNEYEGVVLMRRLFVPGVALLLVLAACGSAETSVDTAVESEPDAPLATADGTDEPSSSPEEAPDEDDVSTPEPGPGASTNFCEFISAFAASDANQLVGVTPEDIATSFTGTSDAIRQALDIAPAEVRDDVAYFSETYDGFVSFLEDNEFNFANISEDELDDPRLTALEDQELVDAGERIQAFCGVDLDIGDDSSVGEGGTPSGDVPAGLQAELIFPNSTVVVSTESVSGLVVLLQTDSSMDDLIDYYTDLLGAPLVVVDDPPTAGWVVERDGGILSVTVGIEDGVTQIVISQT